MGWYYEEKIHYIADQIAKYQPNVTMAMIDQVEAEAIQNGHDFEAYYKRYYRTKQGFLDNLNEERAKSSATSSYYSTGHYTNLIKSNWTITGLSVNAKGTIYYGICQEQCFSTKSTSEAVTPEAFKAALAAFAQEDIDRVAAAEAAVEALKTAPSYVTQAEADLQDAQDTAEQAETDREQRSPERADGGPGGGPVREPGDCGGGTERKRQRACHAGSGICVQ